MTTLENSRVLIVGGARDIGLATAQAVSAAGATAIIGARELDRAEQAAAEIPGSLPVRIDITDEDSISTAVTEVGTIYHLVVTTSAHHNVTIDQLQHDKTIDAFDAKIIGPLILIKHVLPHLSQDGSIVLFSGFAAWHPDPPFTVMGITNGAVAFAATHLAKELAPIRINALSPGVIDSGSWRWMDPSDRAAFYEGAAQASFAGRVGTNKDITDGVLYLLTAGYVTGDTLHIDSGARF